MSPAQKRSPRREPWNGWTPCAADSPVLTVEIILFATVGGLGSVVGPALGAFLLAPLGEILRGQFGGSLPGLHYFIYGVIVVGVILLSPAGIWPFIQGKLQKRETKPPV